MLGTIPQTLFVAGLDLTARRRALAIDTAGHRTDRPAQRETSTIVRDAQMRNAGGVASDERLDEVGSVEDAITFGDLDPVREPLRAVRWQVHAARTTAPTVERGHPAK